MRLRNIPRATEIVDNHKLVIGNPKDYKGRWGMAFENNNPIHGSLTLCN